MIADFALRYAGCIHSAGSPSQICQKVIALSRGRWIVDQPGVTAGIPGARTAQEARDNATVDELALLRWSLAAGRTLFG